MLKKYELEYGGQTLSIETGKLAEQANGAVLVRLGDTIVLATACVSRSQRPGMDFFPLTVDFEERAYAGGKIPGNHFRREGRPPEPSILICRLTDRSIRPFFPKGIRNDVQVILTTLSSDQEILPDVMAIIGASTALTISDIPFDGPIAASKVGLINGELVLNPSTSQLEESDLELVISGTSDAVVMVEAGAQELPEEKMLEALRFGHESIQPIIELQQQMRDEIGKAKMTLEIVKVATEVRDAVEPVARERLPSMVYLPDKTERQDLEHQLFDDLTKQLGETANEDEISSVISDVETEVVRKGILDAGKRPDGRKLDEIRPISCEVGVLPRTHGSGLFTRGQTQILTVATLGSSGDAQRIVNIGVESSKRYIHHYNFPPYSTGEAKRIGSPGRREVGHGVLAERALARVLPSQDDFPYTLRLVSEALSSNGSTSMGSVCGSSLALMDAGVPIKAPVAGVAMGMVSEESGKHAILTDIQGIEDHLGDMDFKVAGTATGITALQMDVKIKGLSEALLAEALEQARAGRLFILDKMLATIGESRTEMSEYAPRIYKTQIPPDKIGTLIGPGGKVIRGLQETYSVRIDLDEEGNVLVSSTDFSGAQNAISEIERMCKDVEIGEEYLGKVVRITNFGVFVEILPGKDGLVRLGDLAEYRVNRAEDVVSLGDEIMVKVMEIDAQGRVNLSRRAVLDGSTELAPIPPGRDGPGGRRPGGRPFNAGGPRGGNRGGPPRRGRGDFRPHQGPSSRPRD
jgi:polyribonucleotide nucleotidyltransferase